MRENFLYYYKWILKKKISIILVWFSLSAVFWDENSIINLLKAQAEIKKLTTEADFYIESIKELRENMKKLYGTDLDFEALVREKYYMRRKGERVLVITKDKP